MPQLKGYPLPLVSCVARLNGRQSETRLRSNSRLPKTPIRTALLGATAGLRWCVIAKRNTPQWLSVVESLRGLVICSPCVTRGSCRFRNISPVLHTGYACCISTVFRKWHCRIYKQRLYVNAEWGLETLIHILAMSASACFTRLDPGRRANSHAQR